MCQAVLAAPVTGSPVSISWLNLKETARNVFSPQKRTYGGADQSKGIVFLVWIQLITEDCSMNSMLLQNYHGTLQSRWRMFQWPA